MMSHNAIREPLSDVPTRGVVLVVDDDPVQRKLTQLALTTEGLSALMAASGEEALRVAREANPDVVLSDVLMPGMDGFQLCAALRSDPSLAATPVVLVSAHYLEEHDHTLALRLGANRYLCRSEGLGSLVRGVLDVLRAPPAAPSVPPPHAEVQTEYLQRVTRQLDRQTAIGADLARQASLQATALSVLDDISDALSRQLDPENTLDDTLAHCVSAAGLSVGAIFLREPDGRIVLKSHLGTRADASAWGHVELLERAARGVTLALPSPAAGLAGDAFLNDVGLRSALFVPIVARDEALGVLVLGSGRADLAGAEVAAMARAVRVVSMQLGQAIALSRMFARLCHSQKMEAVGRLAGGVAHDINNVLAVVLANASLLLDALPPDDPRAEDAEEIRKAAERGAGITRQLLAFSRQQVLRARVLDLNKVLRDITRMLRALIGEDVRTELRLCADLGLVRVDQGQVEQVIMNLAVNARDAMPGGGTLTLATANDGSHVQLTVSDTGVGMDAATLRRIFEPFYTTKEKGKGTGLGLSTVMGIVEQSGGTIDVESAPGRGTAFCVRFPRVDGAAVVIDTHRPLSIPSHSGVILLIEDDPSLRAALARYLRREGYKVLDAETPERAIATAESWTGVIHLVMSDVVMPDMSGPEVVARVRERHPDALVLFMSGYTDVSTSHEIDASSAAFLQKPFTLETLGEKVHALLTGT